MSRWSWNKRQKVCLLQDASGRTTKHNMKTKHGVNKRNLYPFWHHSNTVFFWPVKHPLMMSCCYNYIFIYLAITSSSFASQSLQYYLDGIRPLLSRPLLPNPCGPWVSSLALHGLFPPVSQQPSVCSIISVPGSFGRSVGLCWFSIASELFLSDPCRGPN